MTSTRVLLARMTIAEWVLPRKQAFPGRCVTARVGHVEIERMFSGFGRTRFRTGGWYRRHDWTGDRGRIARLRLTVPWVGGSLWIMDAS